MIRVLPTVKAAAPPITVAAVPPFTPVDDGALNKHRTSSSSRKINYNVVLVVALSGASAVLGGCALSCVTPRYFDICTTRVLYPRETVSVALT
jgi:hypothetical protein